MAINELISNATREAIENSSSTLIPPVKMCLSDSDELVRNFASTAFISLYQVSGRLSEPCVLRICIQSTPSCRLSVPRQWMK